ncbi:hypothetical protein CAPTEDRAFT_214251, partial [Capitella teleta]
AMDGSTDVEVSADKTQMRTKHMPEKWPVQGDPHTFSNLNVDVPEFVPGQAFKLPPQSASTTDAASKPAVDPLDFSIPVLSSSAPELEGLWTEVKRKTRAEKPRTPKKDEVEPAEEPKPEPEELDFMFDEELDELDGRKNTFTDWSDDEDDEIDDDVVNKILIMTQTPPSLRKHPGGDRTGDH